jgi:hypothetical protein
LERLYNSTFQKSWDKTLDRIRLTSPGDLEEMDVLVRKLERYYEISGIKKLSTSLGTYPDEYASKIKSLRGDLCELISTKFRKIAQQVSDLVGDPDDLSDYERQKRRFDEAITLFRMLRAFFSRWRLDTTLYRSAGDRSDFKKELKDLAYRLARKRMLLMKEHTSMKKVLEYEQRTKVLDEISAEVSKLFDWYHSTYLNVDGKNTLWSGSEDGEHPWMVVDFLDDDFCITPLEKFKRVPSGAEMEDIQKLFDRFVEFYRKHELVELSEIGALSDYALFKDYAANFSLYSDDAEERLKAGLMEQMLLLHRVLRDAKERVNLKRHTESMFGNSFAMYFAPVDEIYSILQKGHICSEHSIHHKYSGKHYDNLVFNTDCDIKEGDIGFIFPMTKVLEDHKFYQVSYNPLVKEGLSESNTSLHVFSKKPAEPVKIDIRKGIFIAPKNKIVRYRVDGKLVKETCETYFKRFFAALANKGADWFDPSRLQNWLSRHCVFYDDETRDELLNMLRNKYFVSIINHFTNKRYDNLALAQTPGRLKTSHNYVTHRFKNIPEEQLKQLSSDTFNVTLFEWGKEE